MPYFSFAIALGKVTICDLLNTLFVPTGDIGARFKWDAEKFLPDFSISPVTGYLSPGMEVTFEVLFHPLDINPDIRYEV